MDALDPYSTTGQTQPQTLRPRPGSVSDTLSALSHSELPTAESAVNAYKPVFRYNDPSMLDADPTGQYTTEYGKRTGQAYNQDTILELNLNGEVYSADQLRQVKGGDELLNMARRKRQKPTRDFYEALTTGPKTDFVPFLSGAADVGISVYEMSNAIKTVDKLRNEGPDALTLQEKVQLKLFQENSTRQAQQTWGGLVGSIVRQSSGFALGFTLTNLAGKAVVKAGRKVVGKAVKEGIEETTEKLLKTELKRKMRDRVADTAAGVATEIDDEVVKSMAQGLAQAAGKASQTLDFPAFESRLLKYGMMQRDALTNPNKFNGAVDWFVDHAKAGLFDFADDAVNGAAPGVANRLKEALGVFLVEVPIKGTLFTAFDRAVAKPLIGAAAGIDRIATRSELMYKMSDDPDVARNASWYALGSDWVENASENSGRAFNAIFGMIADVAKEPARRLASGALAATGDVFKDSFAGGSYARKLLAKYSGVETAGEAAEAIAVKRLEAARHFVNTTEGKALGMTAEQVAGNSRLSDKATKEFMRANSEKAFLAFWFADKLTKNGWGPDTMGKWLKTAGYDEILGEFMEERYSGLMQGLLGLDSNDEEKNRLVRAAKGFFPEGGWGQATAEIVAFALPMATRSMVTRAYTAIGAGGINAMADLASGLKSYNLATGLVEVDTSEPGKVVPPVITEVTKLQTEEETSTEKRLGKVKANAALMRDLRSLTENGVNTAMIVGKTVSDQPKAGARIARGVLGIADFILTGNPGMMFHDPMEAMAAERLGNSGKRLQFDLAAAYQELAGLERNRRAAAEAEGARKGRTSLDMLSTDIDGIDKAIRPALTSRVQSIIKGYLLERGTMVVDKADVDSLISTLREENGGKLPGQWEGNEAGFRKEFRAKLEDVAKNDMTVKFVGDRASFAVKRRTGDEMASYVSRFMAPYGTRSYMHLGEAADLTLVDKLSTSPVPLSTYAVVAGITDLKKATEEEYKALTAVINQTEVSPDYSLHDGETVAAKNAIETARRIVGVNKHLLAPEFRREGQFMRAAFDQTSKEYKLGWLPGSFKTVEDLSAAAAKAGLTPGANVKIVFTPFNNVFSENPAMFAALFPKYFTGQGHESNPYAKYARTKDGFALAKAEDAALRKDAETDPNAKAVVETYDAAAEAVLKSHGVKKAPSPISAGAVGWELVPGALNDNDTLYLPMKTFSAGVSVVEDGYELADKRSPGVLGMYSPRASAVVYRPAVRTFISDVRNLLMAEKAEREGKPDVDRTNTDAELDSQLNTLISMFDPTRYNGEAISKSAAGIVNYFADNAVEGIGRNQTEGALYRGLGLVAKKARSLDSYDGFVSSLAQLTGASLIDAPQAMASAVSDMAPTRFIDGTDKATVSGNVNAVEQIRGMQRSLIAKSAAAESFLASKEVTALASELANAADLDFTDLTPEDRIAFANDIRSLMNGGQASGINRPEVAAAETPETPEQPVAKEEKAVTPEATPQAEKVENAVVEGAKGPLAKDPLEASLLQAISNPNTARHMAAAAALMRMDAKMMARLGIKTAGKVITPGTPEYLDSAFDIFNRMAPNMPANAKEMFKKAYVDSPEEQTSVLEDPAGDTDSESVHNPLINNVDENEEISGEEDSRISEEAAETTENSNSDYLANGIRESFSDAFDNLFVKSFMQAAGNQFRGDSFIGHVMDLYTDSLSEDGKVLPGSVADLFSGELSDAHPALAEATFLSWIRETRKTADAKLASFLGAMEVLGFDRAYRFLTNTRAASIGGAFSFEKTGISIAKRTGIADVRDMAADSLDRAMANQEVQSRLIPKIRSAIKVLKDAHAAGKMQELPKLTENYGGRVAAVGARLRELAEITDLMFGEANYISAALRDPITRVNIAKHTDKSGRSAADGWLVSHTDSKGNKYPGFLLQRLDDTIEHYRETHDAKAAVERMFGDRGYLKDSSVRGAFNMVLNLAAGSTPSERERTVDGKSTIALTMPSMSILMKNIVNSEEMRQAALSYFGLDSAEAYNKASKEFRNMAEKAVQRMRRFGVYPDGTPVFANTRGVVTDSARIGSPAARATTRMAEAAFDAGELTAARIYSGDGGENHAVFVMVPAEVRRFFVTEGSKHSDLHKRIVQISGLTNLKPKRVKGFNSMAPSLITDEKSVILHMIPVGSAEQVAIEVDHGKSELMGKKALDAARRYAGWAVETIKVHALSVAGVFGKSSTRLVEEGAAKREGISEADKFRYKVMEDTLATSGASQLISLGGDSLKMSRINSSLEGVVVNGKTTPLTTWLRENPDATADTVVEWTDKGQVKLSDAIPGLVVQRVSVPGPGSQEILAISFPDAIEYRVVANIDHEADAAMHPKARNTTREISSLSWEGNLQRAEFTAQMDQVNSEYRKAHPDNAPVELKNFTLRSLIDLGVVPDTSDWAAVAAAPALARRARSATPNAFGFHAVNSGSFTRLGPDFKTVHAPFGAADPLATGEKRIPKALADKLYNGMTTDPAILRVSGDFFRPSMMVNVDHEVFNGQAFNHKFIAVELERRFETLRGIGESGLRDAYIEYTVNEIMPLFLDVDTKEPFEKGQVFGFRDLFVRNPGGTLVFDRLAIRSGDRALGDGVDVIVGGTAFTMDRTPSDMSSKICCRVLGPIKPGKRRNYNVAVSETDATTGKTRWRVESRVNEDVEAPGSEVIDTPDLPVITGHDEDGDKAFIGFEDATVSRFSSPAEMLAEMNKPKGLLEQVRDPDEKKARAAFKRITRMVANSVWSTEWTDARYRPYPETPRNGVVDPNEIAPSVHYRNTTSAVPYSPGAQATLNVDYPIKTLSMDDSKLSAIGSDEAAYTARLRGVGAHTAAIEKSIFTLYKVSGVVNGGNPVILDEKGEPIAGGMFKADYREQFTQESWENVMKFSSLWANALFDALKGDGFAFRYGMGVGLLSIHFMLLASAKPANQAEYDKFGIEWAKWANGPIGKGIVAHALARNDPGYDGYYGEDPLANYDTRPITEALTTAYKDVYDNLDYGDQQIVLSATAAYEKAGAKGDDAVKYVGGLVSMLYFIESARALLRVSETGYADLGTIAKVDTLSRHIMKAEVVLTSGYPMYIEVGRERSLLEARIELAKEVVAKAYSEAYKGTYEASELRNFVAAALGGGGVTPGTLRRSASPKIRESLMRSIYAMAAVQLTPADVGEKIEKATPTDRGNRTAAFMRMTERVYRSLFAKYAGNRNLAYSNRALNQLIVPRVDENTNDIPVIMLGGDSDSTLDDITSGLETLRTWPADDKRLDVTENGVEFTPRDVWHALRLYAALAALPSFAMRRGSRSIVPLFGKETVRALANFQIVAFNDPSLFQPVYDLAFPALREKEVPAVLRMGNTVPDIFRQAPQVDASLMQWGARSTSELEAHAAKLAAPKLTTAVPAKLIKTERPSTEVAPLKPVVREPDAEPIEPEVTLVPSVKAAPAAQPAAVVPPGEQNVAAPATSATATKFTASTVAGYPARTFANAAAADVTIDFAMSAKGSGGASGLTKVAAERAGKVYVNVPVTTAGFNPVEAAKSIVDAVKRASIKHASVLIPFSVNFAGHELGKMAIPQVEIDRLVDTTMRTVQMLLSTDSVGTIKSIRSGGQTGFDEAGIKAGVALGLPTEVLAPKDWNYRPTQRDIVGDEAGFKARFQAAQPVQPPVAQPAQIPVIKPLQPKATENDIDRRVNLKDGTSFDLTDKQVEAVKMIYNLAAGKESEIALSGPAGSGKTVTVAKAVDEINRLLPGVPIIVAAFTNTAARILPNAITIHKLLGLTADVDLAGLVSGSIKFDKQEGAGLVPEDGLVIVDEASMVSPTLMKLIQDACRNKNARILWSGDARQVAPVGYHGMPPVFTTGLKMIAFTDEDIKRTASSNPLMKTFNRLRNNQDTAIPGSQFTGDTDITGGSLMGYVVARDHEDFLAAAALAFQAAGASGVEGGMSSVRILAGTNNAAADANASIRARLFPNNVDNFLINGELLMGQQMIAMGKETYAVENGLVYVLDDFGPAETSPEGILRHPVTLRPINGKDNAPVKRYIVSRDGYGKFIEAYLRLDTALFNATRSGDTGRIRTAQKNHDEFVAMHLTRDAIKYEKDYGPKYGKKTRTYSPSLQNAYAQTVHKAQGSGIRDVFVMTQSIARFNFTKAGKPGEVSVAAQQEDNNRMLYTAMTRARERAYVLLPNEQSKSGFSATQVSKAVMYADAVKRMTPNDLSSAKAVESVLRLSVAIESAESYLPTFLAETNPAPMNEAQKKAAEGAYTLLMAARGLPGVKGTRGYSLLTAAAGISRVVGFDPAVVRAAFRAAAIGIYYQGERSERDKASVELLLHRAGVGNAAAIAELRKTDKQAIESKNLTDAEFIFRFAIAFAPFAGQNAVDVYKGLAAKVGPIETEGVDASINQAPPDTNYGILSSIFKDIADEKSKIQSNLDKGLLYEDKAYARLAELERQRANNWSLVYARRKAGYGEYSTRVPAGFEFPYPFGPLSKEAEDKWVRNNKGMLAPEEKDLPAAVANDARVPPGVKDASISDESVSAREQLAALREANREAAKQQIANRNAVGFDQIEDTDLVAGMRGISPEHLGMNASDKAEAAKLVAGAVGATKDRGSLDAQTQKYFDQIMQAAARIDLTRGYDKPDDEMEPVNNEFDPVTSNVPNRDPQLRKSYDPEALSQAAMPAMYRMLSTDPAGGMKLFTERLNTLVTQLKESTNQNAKLMGEFLDGYLFHDTEGNPTALQWGSAPGNHDRFIDLLGRKSGNLQSRVLYMMTREENAETDDSRKAELLADRVAVSRALMESRFWAAASMSAELESQRVAVEAYTAGHPAPETPTSAVVKAAIADYESLIPYALSTLDPETMETDPWDRFDIAIADTDVFFQGAVFPFFRGQNIRDILLNKASLAALPELHRVGNFLTMLFAAGNDKGTILKMKKIKGAAFAPDGNGGYEAVPEDKRTMQTRAQRGTVVRDAFNESLTPEEFALCRFMLNAAYAYAGDGGKLAGLPTSGTPSFRDMSAAGDVDLSYAAALERVRRIKADDKGGTVRPWAIDVMLVNAHGNLTPGVYNAVEQVVKAAYATFRKAEGTVAERELAALRSMERSGFANLRFKPSAKGGNVLVSSVLTIPAAAIELEFNRSTAKEKLIRNGRDAKDLTLESVAGMAMEAFRKAEANSIANMGWLLSDDVAPLHDAGRLAPFFAGTGFHSYWSKAMTRPGLPEYTVRMRERYDELKKTVAACFNADTAEEYSASDAYFRAPRMLKFYADLFLTKEDPLRSDLKSLANEFSSRRSPHYLGAGATMWDLARKIYAESASRIHATAAAGGTVEDLVLGDVPLAVFNAAIDAESATRGKATTRGMTWTELYKADGILPRNLGIDEALTQFAQGTATAVRYRTALNQALLAADEKGMPLIYADPGNDTTGTIPDRMWETVARWWSEVHNEVYDNTKTGRENAALLYNKIVPNKQTESGRQEADGGIRRYVFKQVKLPARCSAFARVSAAADRPDDDTKGALTAWAGGEAASVMAQILAVPGLGHPGATLAIVNRTLSWSKSLSVMASMFFPIATAFESPVAAVGFWQTMTGLTETTSEAARKAEAAGGIVAAAAKKSGVDASAPFMADIMRLIGSDDPALVELKVHALLCGVSLSDRSRNMTDHDRTVIAQDIKKLTALASAQFGHKTGKFVKSMLEGAMEESSEFAFEYIINATKLAVFAQLNNKLRAKAQAAGRWWDPIRSMREWAPYINAEVGGIDPAIYPWATPAVQLAMKILFFSWEWTLGAWEAGGGNVLTQRLFGMTSTPATRNFMFGRWFRMATGVLIGLPIGFQLLSTAFGKIGGGDGDDRDDKWFNWQNEQGRKIKDFDITPILRTIGSAPKIAELKRAHPWLMSMVPALTGDEGDLTSSRKRRYYAHMGKQGWEVLGWFQDPMRSFLGKMSMPVQRLGEGLFGFNLSMGWEKEWKDLNFWERWFTTEPEDSALLNLAGAFVPFSLSGMSRSPEAGFINAIVPVGKGMSRTRAVKEVSKMLSDWADNRSFAAKMQGRPEAYNDLRGMSSAWLDAARLNGIDPDAVLKDAVALARRPLYEKVHKALPFTPDGKANEKALADAARGLNRLEFVTRDLMTSIKNKDKRQNIRRSGTLGRITNEALRDSFFPPRGTTRDAALGGNVRNFLASDTVPKTVLGYRVLRTEELSPADLQYFIDTPEAAGHFDKTGEGGGDKRSRSGWLGGDVAELPGRWIDMRPAPAGTPRELTRINRTAKGEGYLGSIPYVAAPNSYMTEQSIDEGTKLKPLLVPTLTPDEIVNISMGGKVPAGTYRKADEFAAKRIAAGKSVWAQSGETNPLHPGLVNMLQAVQKKETK